MVLQKIPWYSWYISKITMIMKDLFHQTSVVLLSVYVLTSLSLFQSLGLRTTGAKKSMENIQLEREREIEKHRENI